MNKHLKSIGLICPVLILAIVIISGCTQSSSSLQVASSCEQKTGSDRSLCYTVAAYKSANSSLCENINDTGYRDLCYQNVAFKVNDSSICNKISNDPNTIMFYLKTRCMALTTENANICDSINGTYKNSCYMEVSGKTENLTLCEMVIPNESRCTQYFQTIKNGPP